MEDGERKQMKVSATTNVLHHTQSVLHHTQSVLHHTQSVLHHTPEHDVESCASQIVQHKSHGTYDTAQTVWRKEYGAAQCDEFYSDQGSLTELLRDQ